MTDLHALEAIRLISKNLISSINKTDDVHFRAEVMQGSLQAGLAFSNAILGANHAMAHSLGGFLDLAHGECNAILLDHVIAFNYDAVPERFEKIGEALGLDFRGLSSVEKKKALLNQVREIKSKAGFDRRLELLGVSHSDLSRLSQMALKDPCLITNPRPANKRDIEVIYGESL
jgi:alcohol dehydrogenase class IV